MGYGLVLWDAAGNVLFDESSFPVRLIFSQTITAGGATVLPGWNPSKGFVKFTPVSNAANTSYWVWDAGSSTLSWNAPIDGSPIRLEVFEVQ